MGVSTDGQICFGIMFEEGAEFPWDEDFGGDIDEWWMHVTGYVPSIHPYTGDGKYAPGFSEHDPRIKEYYDEQRAWEKEHPCPIELVNYCSADCPMYIIAVPRTCNSCRRGYPEKFDPTDLTVKASEGEGLLEFCAKHGIEVEGKPEWYLSSYWG